MGEARDLVERYYAYYADGKLDDGLALFDPACKTVMPNGEVDQAGHREMSVVFLNAFPDSHMVIDHLVESADGDEVVVIGYFRGTHTGDLQSPNGAIPASGNALNLRFYDYFKVRDGRFVDQQTIFDQVEMLGQIGALPA